MKRKEFLKILTGIFSIPLLLKSNWAKGTNPQPLDIHSFKGWLKTKDGRPVYVDNVSNGGYNANSYNHATFLLSDLRIGMFRDHCGEAEVQRLKDISEACALRVPFYWTHWTREYLESI